MPHSLIYHQEEVKWDHLRERYHRTLNSPPSMKEMEGGREEQGTGGGGVAPCVAKKMLEART
jgi:hypothetical protein